MKARLPILLMIGLLLSSQAMEARAFEARGGSSCGKWIEEGEKRQRSLSEAWLLGFLSGIAATMDTDFLQGTDNPSIFLWMSNYCRSYPLDDLEDGATRLYLELKKQKKL